MKPYMTGLLKKLSKLQTQITNYQTKCLHLNADKKHRADTGNFDPHEDRYWTEFKCNDCGKYWTEEGSK